MAKRRTSDSEAADGTKQLREKRLERNRVAAQRSREKRKEMTAQLESKLDILMKENKSLSERIRHLTKENELLKLKSESSCDSSPTSAGDTPSPFSTISSNSPSSPSSHLIHPLSSPSSNSTPGTPSITTDLLDPFTSFEINLFHDNSEETSSIRDNISDESAVLVRSLQLEWLVWIVLTSAALVMNRFQVQPRYHHLPISKMTMKTNYQKTPLTPFSTFELVYPVLNPLITEGIG